MAKVGIEWDRPLARERGENGYTANTQAAEVSNAGTERRGILRCADSAQNDKVKGIR